LNYQAIDKDRYIKMSIKLKLVSEVLLDKNNKEQKDINSKEKLYKQLDIVSILELLSIWDSAKSKGLEDYKKYIKIKDKFEVAWREDLKEIQLSLDDAGFLKDYFSNIQDKSRQSSLREVHLRTIISVLEQLK